MKRLFQWRKHFTKCPRCNRWKPNDQFRSSDPNWCIVCEWTQRDKTLAHIGWLYMYSLHPDDPEFKYTDKQALQENFCFASKLAWALPKDAKFRGHMLDTLFALADKLGLDTHGVLW